MATIGDLVAHLKLDSRQFASGIEKSRSALSSFASFAAKSLATAAAAATAAVAGIGAAAVKLAADAEQTAISFEVMTGSVQTATQLLKDLRKMGASTPFEFTDLANSAKTLMAFGRTTDTILSDLDMLSNIASGDANKLNSLALVFGQISANARLTGGDLLQLVNTGFNPLNNISKRTGETMAQLRDRMGKGMIGFAEVRQAFVDATSAGGLFFKMNEKQSQTLLGKWSTLKDEITAALITIGESIIKNLDLKGVTTNITQMATVFKEDWLPAIEQAIKLAPKLIEAFGQIGQGVGKLTQRTQDWLAAWERFTLIGGGILSGTPPEELAKTMQEMGMVQQQGAIPIEAKAGGKSMLDVMPHTAARMREREAEREKERVAAAEEAKAMQAKLDKLKNPAEKMLGGFIRQGLDAMKSGVMSLGPAITTPKAARELGTLEQGSQAAFDIMRANVGPDGKDKIPEKQLAEAKEQTKVLKKIASKSKEGKITTRSGNWDWDWQSHL